MTSQGFGAGGFSPGGFGGVAGGGELASLARQYWIQWGEMLRAGGQTPPTAGFGSVFPGVGSGFPGGNAAPANGLPGWNEAVAWWSQMASGGVPQADATVQRFNTQAQGWYAQIQQLAARFAGQDASAADVTKAWKDMFGGQGANPFADAMRNMQGPGQNGFEQWLQQVSPWLEKMRQDSGAWLGTPTFGLNREHEQRWKKLTQAQQDYQRHSQGYQALMNEAMQDAFKRFEKKLETCSQPGNQLNSMKGLFDLWIDAAEEAYADIALSPRFRDAYGVLANAQMQLRSAVQQEVEQAGESMGVPTRTEVDAAHRKIARLERELRQLRDQIEAAANAVPSTTAPAAKKAASEPTNKDAEPKSPAVKAASPAVAVKPTVAKKSSKKAAVTPTAKKSAVAKKPAKKSVTPPARAGVKKTTNKAR